MNPSKDRGPVARGATLFSKGSDKKKPRPERKIKRDITITTKTIPDQKNEIEVIRKLELSGIEVKAYKKKYLLRRIKARLSKLNIVTYKEYLDYLHTHPKEVVELQESLSINVTRFFRNRDTFEVIRDDIFPQLIKIAKEDGRNEIKIWSAGCAVGAEPYSLAMIASDVVPSGMNVRIFASDIKDELLNIARYATYTDQYVAEMHPYEIQKYFNHNEHNEYIVKPHIKRLVSFTKVDLMKNMYPTGLDLILCRNVLIYIDREAQNDIMSSFFKSLKSKGMVILGRTETLFVDWRKLIHIVSTKHRIYQKINKTPDNLPTYEYSLPDNKTKKTISIETTHRKRLDELKNFRKTYEDRRQIWEKRIEQSKSDSRTKERNKPISNTFGKINKFSQNKLPVSKKSFTRRVSHTNIQSFTHQNKHSRGLSSFRDSIKKNPTGINKSMSNLIGKKTPEEVYRELKKMRERKSKKR